MQTCTHAKNRVDTIRADTNITLARVVSAVCGQSARRRLAAVVCGESAPQQLSAMALGSWRRQIPQRDVALAGQFPAHHATRMAGALEWADVLGRQSGDMEQHLQAWRAPMAAQRAQLVGIPGVSAITARDLRAESG